MRKEGYRKVRAKAKSSSTPYPIWVEGEYITEPPIRPSDGAVRPAGHYIDKGGYPGANVYEVDINTMCRQTDAADRFGKPIYEQDILLYETAEEIGYFIVQDLETTVDIVNGEIIEVGDLDTENIKNMMNKAMPGPAKDTKRKPKNGRLTEIDPKTNKPRLKSGVPISRAVEVLYMFENTDVLPYQIEEMKVTISNLQTRVKKLEDWQELKQQ